MPSDDSAQNLESKIVEERKMIAKVGKPAPDFEAAAYQGGAFKNVRLSDLKGGWVVLCFYPGDFTFV
jgi:peroxiredoxin (alkyl hydroperoxide reductase subunit C)